MILERHSDLGAATSRGMFKMHIYSLASNSFLPFIPGTPLILFLLENPLTLFPRWHGICGCKSAYRVEVLPEMVHIVRGAIDRHCYLNPPVRVVRWLDAGII